MKKCNHEWVVSPNGKKERCSKCNAARPYDPNRCNHEFVLKEGATKLRCIHCNAARPIPLKVHNIETVVEVEAIQPKKKSFIKRLFSRS